MIRKTALLAALAAMTAPASAQDDTTIRRGADVLRGILIKPEAAAVAAPPSVNDRGDLSTAWMSPILRNRASGSPGTPASFFLYAVNPDAANALSVTIQCYNYKGEAVASYAGSLDLPPLGFNSWASGNAKNVNAVDDLWCAMSAPSRFGAFATSRVGSEPDQPMPMVALAR
jgi:hypothetical protein